MRAYSKLAASPSGASPVIDGCGLTAAPGSPLPALLNRLAAWLSGEPSQPADVGAAGIVVAPSATLDDLRTAVEDELGVDGASFTMSAARARFGPPGNARRDADAARSALRELLGRARSELSLWARFRGFVSVRSLRGGSLG